MSCLSEANVSDGYQKFLALKKQFGHTDQTPGRCFAVEPPADQTAADQPDDLIMIPDDEQERLEFYISSLFTMLAGELLRTFEINVAHPSQLLSLANATEDSRKLVNDANAQKRIAVKKNKIFADYALLGGDYGTAILKYVCFSL
jgi:hypothetical protein